MTPPVSKNDHHAISHINHVTNESHDLIDNLYEELMDRNNDKAKATAQSGCNVMAELLQALTDDI